jgi:hypothetical protein
VPSEPWSKVIGREREMVAQPAPVPLPVSPRVSDAMRLRDREAGA